MTATEALKRHYRVSAAASAGAIASALSELPPEADVTSFEVEDEHELWMWGGPQRTVTIKAELTIEGEDG